MTVNEAKERQFALVDTISRHFSGEEMLEMGDVGVHPLVKRPRRTAKVEAVLADVFGTEAAALVRGAGTGAIRQLLAALLEPRDAMFVHRAPMYTTTKETVRSLSLTPIVVDYNDLAAVEEALRCHPEGKLFYVQHARQQPTDTYDLGEVIRRVKTVAPDLPIVVDDNYCVFKVPQSGVELGADYATFSAFKLLGPEGIGVIVGKQAAIDVVRGRNYSGGSQVQGPEATEVLRALTLAPVTLAVQNEQVERLCELLNEGVPGIKTAYVTNSQSKNVIVELEAPVAKKVIAASEALGAVVYPVGAESRYEVLPMIYRVSGSFLESRPELSEYGLRINPMKAGADTVLRILRDAIARVT